MTTVRNSRYVVQKYLYCLLNKYLGGVGGVEEAFLTDSGGIRMSSSHREVCYLIAVGVPQGKGGPLPRVLA